MTKSILSRAIVFSAAVGLAACDGGSSDSAPAPTEDSANESQSSDGGEAISVSESGWLTVGADGAVQTTFFDPDGRYRDYRNGELVFEGRWEQRPDGALCFEPEEGLGQCWETDTSDSNGAIMATNAEGKSIEIKRITYAAPAEGQGDSEEES